MKRENPNTREQLYRVQVKGVEKAEAKGKCMPWLISYACWGAA